MDPDPSKRKATRRSLVLALGVWAILVGAMFWPVFTGKVIAPLDILESLQQPWAGDSEINVHSSFTYDAVSQYVPYDWSAYQSIRADGYVGWNPYTHSGTSIAGNTMACPGDWHHQLHRFLSFWTSWNTGILIQFLIAGWGMIVLLRQQRMSTPCAVLGAAGFGFYSQFILWICHRWVLGAMCWAPWIVWALMRNRDRGSAFSPLAAIFIALAFRGGHLQTAVFVVLLVGLIAVSDWWSATGRFDWRKIKEVFFPYAAAGAVAALFAADVFLHTVPPFLEGGRDLPPKGWLDTLRAVPTLATVFHPTVLGTPQGLDGFRVFGLDLFSLKFFGGVLAIPAMFGLFHRGAPITARLLAVAGLLVPFTPLDQWLYSRFSVVFALGAVWLGVWQVQRWLDGRDPVRLKWILWAFAGLALGWVCLSAGIAFKESAVIEALNQKVETALADSKSNRLGWMLRRIPQFVDGLYIWNPRNLAVLGLLGAGLWILARIGGRHRRPLIHAWALVAITFAEVGIFASTWITFSRPAEGPFPYPRNEWMDAVRDTVGEGRLAVFSRSSFDFYQLNTGSAYNLRHADGYETVTPRRIDPYPAADWRAEVFAEAGVSHVMIPGTVVPAVLNAWQKVLFHDQFILVENPEFDGLYLAHHAGGSVRALQPVSSTPNRRTFQLPPGTTSLEIKESFADGWRFRSDGGDWREVSPSPVDGQRIVLREPVGEGQHSTLELRFEPPFRRLGWGLWGLAAAILFVQVRWKARTEADQSP